MEGGRTDEHRSIRVAVTTAILVGAALLFVVLGFVRRILMLAAIAAIVLLAVLALTGQLH